jgi:single-strand DNA-binding protein
MASFNKVILVGNLTRDPQVKYTTGGTAVTEIGLAVSRQWTDKQSNTRKEETTFVDITLWGRTAEIAGEYLSKGKQVLIEGRLQLDTWDDRESGQKRSKLKVVGENMTMLGSRGDGGGGGGGSGKSFAGAARGGDSGPSMSEPSDFGGYDEPAHSGGGGDSGGGGGPTDEVPF